MYEINIPIEYMSTLNITINRFCKFLVFFPTGLHPCPEEQVHDELTPVEVSSLNEEWSS